MSNEQVLVESQTAREELVVKISEERANEILNKVKGLVLLPDNMNVTTEMVASFYEVDKELVKYHIKTNKKELESDGLKVLKGQELKEFKAFLTEGGKLSQSFVGDRATSLTLIPRRAILRLGMLIEKSEIAKQIRTYLLDVESNTKIEDKLIALTQENNNSISLINEKVNILEENNSKLITDNEELKHNTQMLINKVDELLEYRKIYKTLLII